MQIALSKTREQFPLSPRKVIKKTIADTLGLAVILLVFLCFTALIFKTMEQFSWRFFGLWALAAFGAILFVALIVFFYQKWYYAFYFYDLTDSFVIIRKSPVTPKEITIPYERIQDISVDQDLLDRFLGLYDVHLSSATITSGMEAHIDGVEKTAADGLRQALLRTVQERISKK